MKVGKSVTAGPRRSLLPLDQGLCEAKGAG